MENGECGNKKSRSKKKRYLNREKYFLNCAYWYNYYHFCKNGVIIIIFVKMVYVQISMYSVMIDVTKYVHLVVFQCEVLSDCFNNILYNFMSSQLAYINIIRKKTSSYYVSNKNYILKDITTELGNGGSCL
jgi:hypothetical protein